jgi:hypothetical protein
MEVFMKRLMFSLLLAAGLSSAAFVSANPGASEIIMIRGYIYVSGPKDANNIKIYKGTEKAEIIELGKVDSKETFDTAVNKIVETVNKYTHDGYELVSCNEFGGGASVILTYTLRK